MCMYFLQGAEGRAQQRHLERGGVDAEEKGSGEEVRDSGDGSDGR